MEAGWIRTFLCKSRREWCLLGKSYRQINLIPKEHIYDSFNYIRKECSIIIAWKRLKHNLLEVLLKEFIWTINVFEQDDCPGSYQTEDLVCFLVKTCTYNSNVTCIALYFLYNFLTLLNWIEIAVMFWWPKFLDTQILNLTYILRALFFFLRFVSLF